LHEKLFVACSQPPLHYTYKKPPPLSTKQIFKNKSLYAESDVIAAVFSCSPVFYDSCVVHAAQAENMMREMHVYENAIRVISKKEDAV